MKEFERCANCLYFDGNNKCFKGNRPYEKLKAFDKKGNLSDYFWFFDVSAYIYGKCDSYDVFERQLSLFE